jgi:hypothetical protein
MNFRYNISRFLPVLMVLLIMAGCNFPMEPSTTLPVEAAAEENGGAAPAEDDTATSVFGPGTFTLSLPEGWDVTGPVMVDAGNGRSYDLWVLGVDPTVNQGPGGSKVAIGEASQWTPEAFVQGQCSTCPVHDFETVEVGGLSALRTQVGGGGVPFEITWYFVELNGRFIAFAIHDPETLEPLVDVIASIQFD